MPTRKPSKAVSTRKASTSATAKEPWHEANPKPAEDHAHLSPKAKAAAKRRAQDAGRRYPNLVDNMHAAAAVKKNGKP